MLYKHSMLEKAEDQVLLDVVIRFVMYVFWIAFVAAMFSLFDHPYLMWGSMGAWEQGCFS